MTTIEHDRTITHNAHWWALSCPKCSQEYAAYVAAGWPQNLTVDPLRPHETDEEPWTVQPEPVTREWSRWAVVLCVASMVFIVLYLGRNGS